MALPGVHVVHHQGVVISPVVRNHLPRPLADQVQFLLFSQPEPRPWKGKCRPRHWLQLQHVPVEVDTSLEVGNVEGHMIKLRRLHDDEYNARGRTVAGKQRFLTWGWDA